MPSTILLLSLASARSPFNTQPKPMCKRHERKATDDQADDSKHRYLNRPAIGDSTMVSSPGLARWPQNARNGSGLVFKYVRHAASEYRRVESES